jgi:hypothetical protein
MALPLGYFVFWKNKSSSHCTASKRRVREYRCCGHVLGVVARCGTAAPADWLSYQHTDHEIHKRLRCMAGALERAGLLRPGNNADNIWLQYPRNRDG